MVHAKLTWHHPTVCAGPNAQTLSPILPDNSIVNENSLNQLFRLFVTFDFVYCTRCSPPYLFHRRMTSSAFRSFQLHLTSHHLLLTRYLFLALPRSAPFPSKFATAVQSNENELVEDIVVGDRQLKSTSENKISSSTKSDGEELSAVAFVTDVNSCKLKMSDRLGQSTFTTGSANAKGMNEYRGTDFVTNGRLNKVSTFFLTL